MSAADHLGGQFPRVEHYFDERDREGIASVYDATGTEVHRLGYARRPQLDDSGHRLYGQDELSGFERYGDAAHLRKGYGTLAQDAVSAAHPGVPLVSYEDDMTEDAHKFREGYMKKRPGTNWALKPGTRW